MSDFEPERPTEEQPLYDRAEASDHAERLERLEDEVRRLKEENEFLTLLLSDDKKAAEARRWRDVTKINNDEIAELKAEVCRLQERFATIKGLIDDGYEAVSADKTTARPIACFIYDLKAEVRRLQGEVAELELTGDRAELRSMLDQLGLDFERQRERAIKAEAEVRRLNSPKDDSCG